MLRRASLLSQTTTNDRDVHVLEVEHLPESPEAADKDFEHEILRVPRPAPRRVAPAPDQGVPVGRLRAVASISTFISGLVSAQTTVVLAGRAARVCSPTTFAIPSKSR